MTGFSAAAPLPDVAKASRPAAVRVALLALVLVVAWQSLLVYRLRDGDWTSLFCTGDFIRLPPAIASTTYIFRDSAGYDGQYYRLIARDPWLEQGLGAYIDNARYRYGRIFVPALAHVFGGGDPVRIDAVYIALVFLSIAAGVYWVALWLRAHGIPEIWGLMFMLTPASLMSADRMLPDGTLCALFAAFLWFSLGRENHIAGFAICVLAGLTRETGLFLAAGAALHHAWERRWKTAIHYASAALPFLAWSTFVAAHTPPIAGPSILTLPVAGHLIRLANPREMPGQPSWVALLVRSFDVLSILALLGSVWLALNWLRNRHTGVTFTIGLFAAASLCAGDQYYLIEAAGFGRPISPLLLWVMMEAFRRGKPWAAAMPLGVTAGVAPMLLATLKKALVG